MAFARAITIEGTQTRGSEEGKEGGETFDRFKLASMERGGESRRRFKTQEWAFRRYLEFESTSRC